MILGWIEHAADDFCDETFARPSLLRWVEYSPEAQSWGNETGWEKQWIGDPTHWMPLPPPPNSAGGEG